MLIGEAAQQAGVSRDAVGPYARLGIVSCSWRQAGSRMYADYDEAAVEFIKGIKIAQSIGFSLAELHPIAAAYVAGQLSDDQQRSLLQGKLADIDVKRCQLRQTASFLRSKSRQSGT